MKDKRLELRTSEEDTDLLEKASQKLRPGKKPNNSATIRAAVKVAATQEPEQFFVNRSAIRDLDNNISAGQKLLQALVDELMKAAPGISVTIEEVARWFGTGRQDFMVAKTGAIREFLISSLFEMQRGRYPGLQFTRENVIVPDLSQVYEAASKLISAPMVGWKEQGIHWDAYMITEDTVTVIPERVEAIKNGFRCYAETAEERARLSKVRALCETLTNFIRGEAFNPSRLNIPDVAHFDHDSGRFEPSELYVKFSLK